MQNSEKSVKVKQNKSVYALSFATAVSFMGIGLVDPILPAISHKLGASSTQAMLLFTSYLIITAIAMYFTAFISKKVGIRKTLISGLFLVIIFSAACSLSNDVNQIISWRAFWGLGNALFISTALSAIVINAVGGIGRAIILYEAAIGIGMAVGPLAGGILGQISWRFPFAGTAILMLLGFISILLFYKKETKVTKENDKNTIRWNSAFNALKNKKLRRISIIALFYNMVFFIVLAYSPFPIEHIAKLIKIEIGPIQLGLVFFVWGIFLAFSSIWFTPRLTKKYGLSKTIKIAFAVLTILLLILVFVTDNLFGLIACIVLSGFVFGILNTSLTEAVMEIKDIEKSVASSAYSGVRFLGGAISSALAGPIAAITQVRSMPYIVATIVAFIAFLVILIFTKNKNIPDVEDLNEEEEINAISLGAE